MPSEIERAAARSYQTGWSDGYAEGYGCKLADATEPFNPQALGRPEAVERIAEYVMGKYRAYFPNPDDAIGLARGVLNAATRDAPTQPPGN